MSEESAKGGEGTASLKSLSKVITDDGLSLQQVRLAS